MPRPASNLRGDESQSKAWWDSLTPAEKKAHKKAIRKQVAESKHQGPVKRAAVRGICKRCGAAVVEGESVFMWNEESHKGCGGLLSPVRGGHVPSKRTTIEPMKHSVDVGGLVVKMWETRQGGVRVQVASANNVEVLVIPEDQRESFASAFDTMCTTLRAWNIARKTSNTSVTNYALKKGKNGDKG